VASINWISLRDEDDFETGVTTLIMALDTDLDHVRTHTRLLVRAKEWDGRQRGASQLLRGSDLTEAESWLAGAGGKEPAPTPLHAQYVLASRRAATRRQRVTIAGVSVALVATVVLAVLALIQRGQAVQQRKAAQARGSQPNSGWWRSRRPRRRRPSTSSGPSRTWRCCWRGRPR